MPKPPTLSLLPYAGGDDGLVQALREREPSAPARLFDRHAPLVRRVLSRVLGADRDLADLVHEVFARALTDIDKLSHAERLPDWLTSIAVFTARGHIRRKKRQRWLRFFAPAELPEVHVPAVDHEAHEAMRATYLVIARLPTEERIVFALRFIESMELTEVAAAAGLSLATVKRRLARAEQRFRTLAEASPVLRERLHRGQTP